MWLQSAAHDVPSYRGCNAIAKFAGGHDLDGVLFLCAATFNRAKPRLLATPRIAASQPHL